MDIRKRIKKSRAAIAAYPTWVKRSMVFHGGGVRRDQSKEDRGHE